MTSRSDFCLAEIPCLYNKLITGEWSDFISQSIDELNCFYEAKSKYMKERGYDNELDFIHADIKVIFMAPREEKFLNKEYLAAIEVQALLWYKEFLAEVKRDGITFYEDDYDGNDDQNKSKRKHVNIRQLQRSNDGFEAIKASVNNFVLAYARTPKWSELMDYMVSHPPQGIIVEGIQERSKLIAIVIEGVDKPIDRAAFKKRFDRYFKKNGH